MSSDRWDPFRDVVNLRDAMSSVLHESFARPGNPFSGASHASLPLDVWETEGEFVVKASLPGVSPDDVQVTVHGDTVTIRGEARPVEDRAGQTWHLRERRMGVFQRSVALTSSTDADHATARFDQGVLTLTLPKSDSARPKQIKVTGG
jgi:HSP20 family protein